MLFQSLTILSLLSPALLHAAAIPQPADAGVAVPEPVADAKRDILPREPKGKYGNFKTGPALERYLNEGRTKGWSKGNLDQYLADVDAAWGTGYRGRYNVNDGNGGTYSGTNNGRSGGSWSVNNPWYKGSGTWKKE